MTQSTIMVTLTLNWRISSRVLGTVFQRQINSKSSSFLLTPARMHSLAVLFLLSGLSCACVDQAQSSPAVRLAMDNGSMKLHLGAFGNSSQFESKRHLNAGLRRLH